MTDQANAEIDRAFRRLPSGLFVLTAEYEDRRMGQLVSMVQRVSQAPPLISIAIGKGWPMMPLISESRQFGLCQVAADDAVVHRKFTDGTDPNDDPFLGLEMINSTLNRIPILAQSLSYMECELVCHIDVDGDHDLFVGRVRAAGGRPGMPYLQPQNDTPLETSGDDSGDTSEGNSGDNSGGGGE